MNFTTDCCCCVIRTTIGWQEFHYVELPLHGSHYLTLAGIRVAAPRAERHRAWKMHTTPTSQRRQSRPSRTNCARCVVNYSPRGTREKHMAESSVDPPTPPCLDLLRNRECDERVAENYCKYCKILSDESLILGERFPKYLQVFLFVFFQNSRG